jgi:hypothetical protein
MSAATIALCAPVALAQYDDVSAKDPEAGPPSGPQATDASPEAKEKKEKPDFPDFAEVTKEHKEVLGPEGKPGFFPLYHREKDDQLLCVVPNDMLGKNFLVAMSIAGGPGFAGWMWGDRVVQWQEMDKKLVLIEPDLRYKQAKKGEPVADVIERTYTESIVLATPIVTKKNGSPVIDLGQLFKDRDFAQVSMLFGGRQDSSLSKWAKYKCFPDNVEVAVDGAFMQGTEGGTRGRVHYSLVRLPENDYQPRLADDRIGYFLTAVKDWTTEHRADTIFKRYINRWDVRKAEPDKEISDVDPDHQIVFYIEKTVPVQYRRYVREGILLWNKAYEKAGFRNAVRVEQQTDTVHADKDPEDVRYAFVRWIVSGRAFAMGPSLANPLTGQILDADIIFDDSMARVWELQYAKFSGTGLAGHNDPQLAEFFEHHPEWKFQPMQERLLPESTQYAGVDMDLNPAVAARLNEKQGFCTLADGLAHEMAFGMAWLTANQDAASAEEFVGQMIKYVTCHEVGHTLGLRHNFKASSWKSVEDILANTGGEVALTGSVMDYNAPLLNPDKDSQTNFATQAVGPYDQWAIEYGYTPFKASDTVKTEQEMLDKVAARGAEDGLSYATDEDTTFFSPDPLVNRWDNGSDVIGYAKHRMEMVRRLQKDMQDWAVADGDSYARLRATFNMLLGEYGRSATFAARYVGGQYLNRSHKGDPDAKPPIQIVEAAKQREAFDFLINTVFSERDFQFKPDLLNKLAAGRWMHWDSDEMDSQLDFPIHDRIAATQYGPMFQLLNPFTLDRIYDAELKVPADQDAITVPEVIERTNQAIWAELAEAPGSAKHTNRKPLVSSVRRSLQRQHLSTMLNIVLSKPGSTMSADIHAVVCMKLKELSDRMGEVIEKGGSNLDDFTRAHLDASKSRIDRALAAKYQL